LPSTLVIDVVERRARAVVVLSSLYLADGQAALFKRANTDEAAELPVVTGIDRERFLGDPEGTRGLVRSAIAVIDAWGARPALGEVHLDSTDFGAGVTLYTADTGLGVRLGRPEDPILPERLRRLDAVLAALARSGERARLVYLDNRARPDRVTVKLTRAEGAARSAL
jgi:cell division protein FtsQ